MTKPEGIPEDVLVDARECFVDWCRFNHDKSGDPAIAEMIAAIRDGKHDDMPMLKIAHIAILNERERAAGIADDNAHADCDVAEQIARFIRSPHNPKDAQ